MRLYHAAKISEYQFRKLLHLYVADATVAATCRLVRVSGNTVSTLHNRLRSYYVEAGLFTDPYRLGSHMEEEFEIALLQFHLARLRAKRRLRRNTGGLDIHLAESHWRFHFFMLAEGRDASSV